MSRWSVVGILGALAIGCGSAPTAPPTPTVQHVYVTWTTDGPFLQRVPDEIAHDALTKLEAAAGGALVVHRQQIGTPQVRIRIDDAAMEANGDYGDRGLAWVFGPCSGDVALGSSAVADSFVLLHELGHVFIGGHSPYPGDVLAPGGTFHPGDRPTTFSAHEAALLRANMADGCSRISTWPGR